MLAAGVILLLFVLLAIGIPVGFATAAAGAVGLYLVSGWGGMLAVLQSAPLSVASENVLATIAMFVLLAEFMLRSGAVDELFEMLNAWIGQVPGGLGLVTILTGAGFATICGSSTAAAAALAPTTIPQMVKRGYNPRLSSGLVTVVGTLAIMMPLSSGLILYAVIANVSIAKMLVAGLVPSFLAALSLILTLWLVLLWRPEWAPRTEQRVTWQERIRLLRYVGPIVALVFLTVGLIYFGVATPTEAGSVGAFGAFVILGLRRRLTWEAVRESLISAAGTSVMIIMIVVGAYMMGYFLTLSQVAQGAIAAMSEARIPAQVVVGAAFALHFILSFFMEQISILVLIVPITLPIVTALGFDPIWYGVLNTLIAEIGLVTPPVGLNLFVVERYSDQKLGDIFRGVLPFMSALILLVFVLWAFPGLSLWLPNTMH
jgi:C4-dicarboxylate transporter, DctM subunit